MSTQRILRLQRGPYCAVDKSGCIPQCRIVCSRPALEQIAAIASKILPTSDEACKGNHSVRTEISDVMTYFGAKKG